MSIEIAPTIFPSPLVPPLHATEPLVGVVAPQTKGHLECPPRVQEVELRVSGRRPHHAVQRHAHNPGTISDAAVWATSVSKRLMLMNVMHAQEMVLGARAGDLIKMCNDKYHPQLNQAFQAAGTPSLEGGGVFGAFSGSRSSKHVSEITAATPGVLGSRHALTGLRRRPRCVRNWEICPGDMYTTHQC